MSALTALRKHLGAKRLRKVFADLVEVLTKSEAPVPHWAVFLVSSHFSIPSQFSISDITGLLLCHVVKGTPNDRVITYWIDEPHFRAYVDAFSRAVGVTTLGYTGAAVELKRRLDPWWMFWRRISAKEIVVAVFAFTGAVLGIRDYSAVLFAAPEVTLSYPGIERIDSVEGSQITLPVTVRSEVRLAPAFVEFTAASIRPRVGTGEKKLLFDTASLPSLATGEFKSVNIGVQVPPHSGDREAPDIYDLVVVAKSKAGILRSERSVSAVREFWVWPAQPGGPPPKIAHVAGPVCELAGTIYIAKPYPRGLAAEFAQVVTVGTIPDLSVTADRDATSAEKTFSTENTRKTEFHTPPIERFHPYLYKVSLISTQPVTHAQCESWARGLRVSLSESIGEQ